MVTYTDTIAMSRNPETNPYGVGFEVHTTEVKEEVAFNLNWETNRVVMMTNPKSINRFSKKPVAYKIVAPPTQLGLADETSMHNRRGEFVNNHLHVTKYHNDELFAAGEHPWQSTGVSILFSFPHRSLQQLTIFSFFFFRRVKEDVEVGLLGSNNSKLDNQSFGSLLVSLMLLNLKVSHLLKPPLENFLTFFHLLRLARYAF